MGKKKSQKQMDLEAFEKWLSKQASAISAYWEDIFLAGVRYERSRVKRAKKGRG